METVRFSHQDEQRFSAKRRIYIVPQKEVAAFIKMWGGYVFFSDMKVSAISI